MTEIIIGTLGILLLGLLILCWWQDERIAQLENYQIGLELRLLQAENHMARRIKDAAEQAQARDWAEL